MILKANSTSSSRVPCPMLWMTIGAARPGASETTPM